MNSTEHLISHLAKFLRINGDKVINGTFKLSLTTSALCLLNNIFVEVLIHDRFENADPVTSHCDTKSYEDAQFLFDFIKKTPALKLFHGAQTLRGGINLSHFTSLRVLELRKLPTHLIVGLTTLSSQLKALICHRSICSLRELFGNSVEEPDLAGIWTELVELNVSYNYLEELDDSLKILPNIEVLDSSHNNLKHTDDIQILNNLIVVNLSYNELDHLPVFSNLSCYALKVLFIRNNNLDDLQGLEYFINLEEFDASCNSLSEYTVLKPLEKLKFLKVLYLEGNPLYFSKRHREITARYLHADVINRGILLNGKNLSSDEVLKSSVHIRNISYSEPIGGHQTSINVIVEEISNVITRPEFTYPTENNTSPNLAQTISDENHSLLGKDDESSSSYSENTEEDIKLLKKTAAKVKRRTMREAVIFEAEQSEKKEHKFEASVDNVPIHLQTKQLLETRRKEYGSEWLIPTHSFQTLVTDPTIPKVPFNTPVSHLQALNQLELPIESSLKKLISNEECHSNDTTSVPTENKELTLESLKQCSEPSEAHIDEHFESIDISTVSQEYFDSESEKPTKSKVIRQQSQLSDDIEVISPHVSDSRDILTNKTYPIQSPDKNISGSEVFQWTEYSDEGTSDGEDSKSGGNETDEGCEARIFVVEKKEKDKGTLLFISIGDKFMKEKDCLSGKIIDTLDLRSLFSIKEEKLEMENNIKYAVHLVFDTPKTSRQKREYVFDELESTKNIIALLQPFVDAKTLEDMTLGALQCLKCGAQFSKQGAHRKLLKTSKPYLNQSSHPSSCDSSKGYLQEADMCPSCGSIMIVEIDTFPVPSVQLSKNDIISKNQTALEASQKTETSASTVSLSSSPGGYLSNLFSSILNSPKLKRKQTSESLRESQIHTSVTSDFSSDSKENKDTDSLSKVLSQGTLYEKSEDNRFSMEESDLLLRQGFKRSSSDITILSNPSQSSIAVISSGSEGGLILDVISERDSIYSPMLPLSPTSQPDTEHQADLLPVGPASTIYSESASTGSACSSVCTAVEKNASDKLLSQTVPLSDTGKEMKKELSAVEGNVAFKSNVYNEASGIASDNSDTYHSVGENVSYKECISDTSKNISVVTSTQSSSANQSSKLNTLLAHRETISYEHFSSIDHRLKLHLEVEVFGTDEVLDACLEAGIIPLLSGEEFNGMLVISSKKIYIMKLLGSICEEMNKCMQLLHCWSSTQLKSVQVLLGSQGFITVCGTESKTHIFILRDADICNCFIAYLTDLIRQQSQGSYIPKFETSTEESLNQLNKEIIHIYYPESAEKNKETEVLLYLLAFWSSASLREEKQPVAIVITEEDVLISHMTYKKLPAKTKVPENYTHFQYTPIVKEKISNLTKVDLLDSMLSVELHFLDEDINREHCWTVTTQTRSSLFSFINALKTPWENLFGIELPL